MLSKNTPFTVSADHAGQDTDSYRLYVNNVVAVEKPVSALNSGVISFADADGLPKGSYAISVAAVNSDGEARSEVVTLVITGAPPQAPVNVRFAVL